MTKKYYAHTKEGRPPEKWQELEEHLKNVAEMARVFAKEFWIGDLVYLARWTYKNGIKLKGFKYVS